MAEQGVTQAELAERLGVKQPSVAQVLSPNAAKIPQSLIDVLNELGLELVVKPKRE